MTDDTIIIPISATYRIIDGEVVRISAEYREVSADFMARFILDGLHIPYEEARP